MKIHHITLSIIVVSMIVLGLTTYITGLSDKYGTTADLTDLNKTDSRLKAQQATMNTTYNDIQSIKLSINPVDLLSIPYKMIRVGWGSIKTLFGSWTVLGGIMSDLNRAFSKQGIQLPDWLIPSIIAIIMLAIIAICVFAFFKWKFED